MTAPSDERVTFRSLIDDRVKASVGGEMVQVVAELAGDDNILQKVQGMTVEQRKAVEAEFVAQLLAEAKEAEEQEHKLWNMLMEVQENAIQRRGYTYALETCVKRRSGPFRMRKDSADEVGEILAEYCRCFGKDKRGFVDASTITEENPEGLPRFVGLESVYQRAHSNVDRLVRMAFYERYIPTTSDCPPTAAFAESEEEELPNSAKKKRKRRNRKRNKCCCQDELVSGEEELEEFQEDATQEDTEEEEK